MRNQLTSLLITVPAVLLAICIHEAAHGWVSYLLGDPTPKRDGRLSLDPLHHLDLTGTLCLLLFHFGWAKPVQINPYYYKNRRLGIILTALAGPVSNFITAFLCMILYRLISQYGNAFAATYWLSLIIYYGAIVNVGLGVFNLIPLPPLDGSRVLGALIPSIEGAFYRFQRYGQILLVVLIMLGVLTGPLGTIQNGILNRMWQLVVRILPTKALAPIVPGSGSLV